jgi:hypothetical protein
MRIDKVTNGQPTFFIFPNPSKLTETFNELNLTINFKNLYLTGITNLVKYAKKTYRKITLRPLERSKLIEWYKNSFLIRTEIPGLEDDFTYLLSSFLHAYKRLSEIEFNTQDETYQNVLINYSDLVIAYFRNRIKKNYIKMKYGNEIVKERLYNEKRGKYYPLFVSNEVFHAKTNKLIRMYFIPYLIYDDIIDVFFYNKKMLTNNQKSPVDLKILENYKIIIKGSCIKNNNLSYLKHIAELGNSELERIL